MRGREGDDRRGKGAGEGDAVGRDRGNLEEDLKEMRVTKEVIKLSDSCTVKT
jgi:hypothetical protein